VSIHVLDASALVAYLSGEPGAKVIDDLLNDPGAVSYAHSMNLCEVFYDAIRKTSFSDAQQVILDLRKAGVIERRDMSKDFWQNAAALKARGRISLPDCFCISLAQKLGGEVVTSDHGEFDPLMPLGIVPIHFIR
jgi:PIN domain nuclease of toxin-antitoxin system